MKIILSIFFVFFMYTFSNAQCTCDNCGGGGKIILPESCYKCGASGLKACQNCAGDGNELCKQCAGSGKSNYENCRSCGGSGKFVCSWCGGAGAEYCSLCGGKGYEERFYSCEICGETGEIPCP